MIKKIFGVILIALGIVGLFLPFLQGIALIILGYMMVTGKKFGKKDEDVIVRPRFV